MKTGTLQELNVQPGDVVVNLKTGNSYTVAHDMTVGGPHVSVCVDTYGIISRAPRDENPKLWRDMTAEEKGALLLAAHEGEVIEHDDLTYTYSWEVARSPTWNENIAYRVKPDDDLQRVSLMNFHELARGYFIEFEVINGEPDPTSIRMERL